MSIKKRKQRPAAARLQAVPGTMQQSSGTASAGDQQTAAGRVWLAVQAHPRSTAAQIALAAGVSGSAARKALSVLAEQGCVVREPSGQRGVGDRWRPVDSDEAGMETPASPAETTSTDDADQTTDAGQHSSDTAVSKDGAGELQAAPGQDHSGNQAPVIDPAAPWEGDSESSGPERAAVPAVDGATATRDAASLPDSRRLAPGALRGQVEDWLRDHPTQEFTPGDVSRKLQRSSGAIANACDKLVSDGRAVKTSEKPKKYRVVDDE